MLNDIEMFTRRQAELTLNSDATALLVTDMQNYFLEPDSNAYIPAAEAITDKVNALIKFAEEKQIPVFFTAHVNSEENAAMMSKWWKRLIDENDKTAELSKKLYLPDNSLKIIKHQYDCFYNTGLEAQLRSLGINTLIVCGVMTNLCVETTVRSAFVRGFRVLVPIDATAAYNFEFHKSACLNLAFGFAGICLTEDLIKKTDD